MPWQETTVMSQRREFVTLAGAKAIPFRELCRRFGVSPPTGYEWLARYDAAGIEGLTDRSHRPHDPAGQTAATVEAAVIAVRQAHPAWGGRKIRRWLQDHGHSTVPAASTITAILRRTGLLTALERPVHAWQRFERAGPNELWQMDFKGHFALHVGRCHPLTVLDDHARYNLGLQACGDEQGATVRTRLTAIFRRYGLPWWLLMDNGSPWGYTQEFPWTRFTVWLLRLGVGVTHGAPYHPQTQGKDERFHRTMQAELLGTQTWRDLDHCQGAFDRWRTVYNEERPHEALELATPASRYQPSLRAFPESLPPIEYGPGDHVRRANHQGVFSWRGHPITIGLAFAGLPVALRPTQEDGIWHICFCHQVIRTLDLHTLATHHV